MATAGEGAGLSLPETSLAPPEFAHLWRLLGEHGLFEHARYRQARRSHGYTIDDNARALVVTAGVENAEAEVVFQRCLPFVCSGLTANGWHNRMSPRGRWIDQVGSEDAHGRALWGLGVAARHGALDSDGVAVFNRGTERGLVALRAVAYGLIGAAEGLADSGTERAASRFLQRMAGALPRPGAASWPWPESRLTYDNARIPQAMMVTGEVLGDQRLAERGLELLAWLISVEARHDRFSFTPVGGRGRGEYGPAFDQQPLEAWAMADACLVAARISGDGGWLRWLRWAVEWFSGRNDGGLPLYDPADGACCDGLEDGDVNQNRGAESTLAALGAIRTSLATRGFAAPSLPPAVSDRPEIVA